MPASDRPALVINAGSPRQDWYRQLGATHRERDASAEREAEHLEARERERQAALRLRWPTIVASIRALSRCYNDGAGLDVLTVVDGVSTDRRNPTLQILARGGRTLTMTLVGVEICVRTTPVATGAADGGRRWIGFGTSDEATAANVLQHWLTQF